MTRETVYGVHAVLEVLQAGRRPVEKLFLVERRQSAGVRRIMALAKQREIPMTHVVNRDLRNLIGHDRHQGIAVMVGPLGYESLDDHLNALSRVSEADVSHTWLVLDGVTDVGNFATLIRSSVAFGVDVICVPQHNSVGLSPVVAKRSAGAVENVSVVQAVNIVQTLDALKSLGFWVYGTEMQAATNVAEVNWPARVIVVVGAEGRGMRRLVRDRCDNLIRIPMDTGTNSLNAAVAGSIVLSHIWAQHESTKG